MEDQVRVLRVIEYVGSRSAVEHAVKNSLHGEHHCKDYVIRAATVGIYPEILTPKNKESKDGEGA